MSLHNFSLVIAFDLKFSPLFEMFHNININFMLVNAKIKAINLIDSGNEHVAFSFFENCVICYSIPVIVGKHSASNADKKRNFPLEKCYRNWLIDEINTSYSRDNQKLAVSHDYYYPLINQQSSC